MIDAEIAADCAGGRAVLERLCSTLTIVCVLRHCMQSGLARGGALAALADARLSKALAHIHGRPGHRCWTVQQARRRRRHVARALRARLPGNSVGSTPNQYVDEAASPRR